MAPGLDELADESDLRFLLLIVEGLSGWVGGIADKQLSAPSEVRGKERAGRGSHLKGTFQSRDCFTCFDFLALVP